MPKKSPLSEGQLEKRKEFINTYGDKSADWWVDNIDLVFDGVTLTKAPKSLSNRQKHAAQAIKAMWMKRGEAMDPDVHTYNRYSFVSLITFRNQLLFPTHSLPRNTSYDHQNVNIGYRDVDCTTRPSRGGDLSGRKCRNFDQK